MKACIPTSISLIGGLASHFCLFATPSMTPTVSSEPLSTESPSRICQQRSSIQVTSPRTFPTHGTDKPVPVDFDTFWRTPTRDRVFDRMVGQQATQRKRFEPFFDDQRRGLGFRAVPLSTHIQVPEPVLRRRHLRRCGLTSGWPRCRPTGTPSRLAHHWASGSSRTSSSAGNSATSSCSAMTRASSCSKPGVSTSRSSDSITDQQAARSFTSAHQ